MIKELMEFYEPEKISHRNKQIEKIKKVFDQFNRFGMAKNLLCQGVSGSGKTLSINNILKTQEGKYIYVDCTSENSTYKILKKLFKIKHSNISDVLNEGIESLKKSPKIIIVDETYRIEDQERFFNCLNAIFRKTGSPIILISNKESLISKMPEDARLTLFFDKITFSSYNAEELRDILKERLKLINIKNMTIPEGAINFICGEGAKEKGSARMVLSLMRECILENKFTQKDISEFKEKIKDQELEFLINGLNKQDKRFLETLLELKSLNKENITSPEILEKMGGIHLTHISASITYFESKDILKCKYENLGLKGGRRRIIDFFSPEMFSKIDKLLPYQENATR